MNQKLSSKQAKIHFDRLKNDLDIRLRTIDAEIEQAEKSNFFGIVLQLQAKRNMLNNAYEAPLERAKTAIIQAENEEATEVKAAEERRQAAVKGLKDNALKAWVRHGGSPDGFEEAWPDMYKQLMTDRALEDIKAADKSGTPTMRL